MAIAQTAEDLRHSPPGRFTESILRGVGQIFLQDNPITGALILLGIFLSSWQAGIYAAIGTIVATGTAMLLGVRRQSIDHGLYGFNGTLVAIDLSFYLRNDWHLVAFVVVASAMSSVAAAALQNFLGSDHIPTLTGAFVGTTWLFLAALKQFANLTASRTQVIQAHLPREVTGRGGTPQATDLLTGFFNGFSEVVLQSGVWTGIAILLGILINSRISAAAAAVGSLVGFGTAWALGFPVDTMAGGLAGYNSVLTVIALGGLYYLFSVRSALFAVFGGIVTVVALGALNTILAPVGLPVVTAPFVLTTWVCIFAASSLKSLRPIHPHDVTTPEGNLKSTGRRWSSTILRRPGQSGGPETPDDGRRQ